MNTLTDGELLKRSRRGDGDAFAELVARYWPLVHSLALSFSSSTDMAGDLAQEALCRAYAHMDDLKDPGKFRAWLSGITRNVCRDWLRKSARENARRDLPAEGAPGGDDPAHDAELSERREHVRKAVDELPEKFRIVVYLRHLEGLPYKEIAQMLDMSLSGVANRLAEAHEMLRVKLRPLL
ncbi:MAG: sigma-70 family RNA polymerase sigma factor [Planctomycetes bacterium]|nr:sigma-70 family RNA polymerase sigma factor [Planctomycetota bacterium]